MWSLTSATIAANFDSALNLKLTRLLSRGVQSASSFRRHPHCTVAKKEEEEKKKKKKEKKKDFPDLEINTSQL